LAGFSLYHSAKFYVYRTIVARTHGRVPYANLKLTVFPLGLKANGVRDFPLKIDNLVSFRRLNVTMPFRSLLTPQKWLDVELENPRFDLQDDILKSGKPRAKSPVTLRRIDIVDGTLFFHSGRSRVVLRHFNLRSGLSGEDRHLRLEAPMLQGETPLEGEVVVAAGPVWAEGKLTDEGVRISQFQWQTRPFTLKGSGRIQKGEGAAFAVHFLGDPQEQLTPLLDQFSPTGRFAAAITIAAPPAAPVDVKADISAAMFSIQRETFQNLNGHLHWDSRERAIGVKLGFSAQGLPATLDVQAGHGPTRLEIHNVPAGAISRLVDIAGSVPVGGTVRAAQIVFPRKRIEVVADLDPTPPPEASPATSREVLFARGRVSFQKDKPAKRLHFSTAGLLTPAGKIDLEGTGLPGALDLQVACQLEKSEEFAPIARYYLGIELAPWKLTGGRGRLGLTYRRREKQTRISSRFSLEDFASSGVGIRRLDGTVETTSGRTRGEFAASAPGLNGTAVLSSHPGETRIDFHLAQGEMKALGKVLALGLDASGPVQGDFTYLHHRQPLPLITGTFSSPGGTLSGFYLNRLTGRLSTDTKVVRISDLAFAYHQGTGRGELEIDFGRKSFRIDAGIHQIDLHDFHSEVRGKMDLVARSSGRFNQDPLSVGIQLENVSYYRDRPFSVRATADFLTDFDDFTLTSRGEIINLTGRSPLAVDLIKKGKTYTSRYTLTLHDLDLLIPWRNNSGTMQLLGQAKGEEGGQWHHEGTAILTGPVLSIPNFPHSLDKFSGLISFVDGKLTLQSLKGELGGGTVTGSGHGEMTGGALKSLYLNLIGRGMTIYPLDRANGKVDADLTLKQVQARTILSGNLNFSSAVWERDLAEGVSFYSGPQSLAPSEAGPFDKLEFDIHMSGADEVWMNNSFGKIKGRFNLHLTGRRDNPMIQGSIEGVKGEIYFSDRVFQLLKGRLTFNNPFRIDPLIQLETEAFVQNYRIRFTVNGTASHPHPEFSSSPPLPPADILALISLGELFKRSGSSEVSSQISSATFLTGMLTNEIKNRTHKFLGLDLLRIDAMFTGQASINTSRLTIGKAITKDLIVVYSTNLSPSRQDSPRQEIIYMQYQLSPSISLIGMKNEEGKLSFDIHFRRRD